jgi:hypothetical protein
VIGTALVVFCPVKRAGSIKGPSCTKVRDTLGLRIVYRRLCSFGDNNGAIASSDPARVNVRTLVAIVITDVEFIF